MRETHTNRYVSGTYWRECADCGQDWLRKDMVVSRDGLVVCPKCHYPNDSYDERPRPSIREQTLIVDGIGQHDET